MRVEADPDIGVSVTTVGELRKVTAWPENLVITTPQDHNPESAVKVSKASIKGSRVAETVVRGAKNTWPFKQADGAALRRHRSRSCHDPQARSHDGRRRMNLRETERATMKLPRRRFLHLAAGVPRCRPCHGSQGRKPIRRGRCDCRRLSAGSATDILARLLGEWL